ncbi:MAG: sugar transferase [Candidatus Zixiibacteriota bacterium]|nr:MAG: sugar transferase [candidate division Zixibacteria bacterium]
MIISSVALLCTLLASGSPIMLILESLMGLIAIRLLSSINRMPRPVLTAKFVHKHLWQVVDTELKVSLGIAATVFFMEWPVDRLIVVAFIGINFILQLGHCYLTRFGLQIIAKYSRKGDAPSFQNRILIVGTGPRAKSVADIILRSPELEASIEGFLDYHRSELWRYRDIPLIGHPDLLEKIIAKGQLDAIILAVERDDIPLTSSLVTVAEKMGVTVSVIPDMYRPSVARPVLASLNGVPTMTYRAVPECRFSLFAKNLLDRLGALAGLLITFPLTLVTAIIIKLDSKGPVLFKQVRSGINGKPFHLLKFRTMCHDAENRKRELMSQNELSGPAFKIKNDPRVTRVGRFLRKYSIDELPQLLNVIRGEMSLVGPRPPLQSEVSQYQPWQHRKLSVKPGLTCIWQVSGRNNINFDEWMRMDLEYIDNWSLLLDSKILARTLPAVLKGRGAS